MKKIILLPILVMFLNGNVVSQGITGKVVGGAIAKDVIKKASDEITKLLAMATNSGDYLLEKNLSRLQLLINNLAYALGKDLDKRVDQLEAMESKTLFDLDKTANGILQNAAGQFLQTKEFLVMDIDNILASIPFFKSKRYISSINGIGQRFKTIGTYRIDCKGTVFKLDTRDSVFINGKALTSDNIEKTMKNVLSFDIPVQTINGFYKLTELNRVSLVIKSYWEKESVWYNPFTWFSHDLELVNNYSGNILLLPKYPVINYTLLESTNVDGYSKEEFESETGHLLLQPSQNKDEWTYNYVETSVPTGTLLIKGSETSWGEPGIGWVSINGPYIYDDANGKVRILCGNQWYNAQRNFWIKCKYRKPETTTVDTKVNLESLGKEVSGALGFGTYTRHLPPNYSFFVLELHYFNGEILTFTPYDQPQRLAGVELKSAGNNRKNLVVTIIP